MSNTFKYNVVPHSAGGFTTRAVLQTQIDETVLLGEVATAAGTTPEAALAVIKALCTRLRSYTATSHWSPLLFGEIGVRPTCGGRLPSPDAFNTPEELNADISLGFSAESITDWQATLSLESMGTRGYVTPVINTILSEETGAENKYTALTMIRLVGHDLRFDKTDTTQGVFFIKPDNSEVRASAYGPISPSSVTVLVPAALTGQLQVRISASINGGNRNFLYTSPINNV